MSSRRSTPDEEYVDDDDEIINQDAMDEEDDHMTPVPEAEEPEDEVGGRARAGEDARPTAPAPGGAPGACAPARRAPRPPTDHIQTAQGELPDEKKEIARQERERLRLQEQQKKEALERLRAEENRSASKGEVRGRPRAREGGRGGNRGPARPRRWRGRRGCTAARGGAAAPLRLPHRHPPPPPPPPQASRESNRLAFLLKQAEIFQHFAPAATLEKAKKQ
jgi:hypothetical protein